MNSQQLLAQGEVLEDEVIPQSERRKESSRAEYQNTHKHPRIFNGMRAVQAVSLRLLILRMYGIMAEPQALKMRIRGEAKDQWFSNQEHAL